MTGGATTGDVASVPVVVTAGETMGAFAAVAPGAVMRGQQFRVGVAGSESNVAIVLARLGVATRWVGCVGDDGVGAMILRELRAERVDVRARTLSSHQTGVMVKSRPSSSHWSVSYHRRESAGAQLSAADLSSDALAGATVLHLTGITLALGPIARSAVFDAVRRAKAAGILVSFDVNHRRALWSDEEASRVLADLVPSVDVLFAGLDEARLLASSGGPREIAQAIGELGPREVVLKMGAAGSGTWTASGGYIEQGAHPVSVVDPVGAGDAFVAGYLAELVAGGSVVERLALGARLGERAVSTIGDWEGAPTRAELQVKRVDEVAR
ncbi:MAG TPA: sugar kinase [Plantibacter sp.]|uniref:sugar kinase n=1 Tax=Plantibacter sp. TaxID=1871045 RepID=UPI002B817A2B|nr:sugar kinase [Plantibacter sp.]